MSAQRMKLGVLVVVLALVGASDADVRRLTCEPETRQGTQPDQDLYCLTLIPTPDLLDASGTATMGRVNTPFGVAVSSNGRHAYDLTIEVDGLPEPSTLGPYTTYVAWATTPVFDPVIKLGEVRDGVTLARRIDFNKFLVLISAEGAASVQRREGRLVLRGMSPSMRMFPDQHLMLAPTTPPIDAAGVGQSWTMPPMHPRVPMLPGMEWLRPKVAPFLPSADPVRTVDARPRELYELNDGDTLDLEALTVRRRVLGRTFTMYGFNGQYPGPLIEVEQNATITVNFTNRTDLPSSVHWHGVRLDNRYDGVPGVTQDPVEPGESFQYRIFFRDAGIYWYHPHHREDIQQDLGLYGNMLVRSPDPDFFNKVHREEVLMLDDLLVGEHGLFPFGKEAATHALMGRFGNVLLVNGEPEYELAVGKGEVVRFFLTNVSNTRTFNLSFGEARIKVVGSDLGKYEREVWAESVVLAPAERYIVEVLFDETSPLVNHVQILDHSFGSFFAERSELGTIAVADEAAGPNLRDTFLELRTHHDVVRDLAPYRAVFDRPLHHELVFTLRVSDLPPKLMQRMRADSIYFSPVEWSGTMPMMNFPSTSREAAWILRDTASGKENLDIDWRFEVGDVAKIRLVNDREAIHAMQHPFHIHGQRFLVLSRNGALNDNLVWKDTMLLSVGETADILLELSNPGRWMAHCHIAEHLETGMKLVFTVE